LPLFQSLEAVFVSRGDARKVTNKIGGTAQNSIVLFRRLR
jgi:hypothetical protein